MRYFELNIFGVYVSPMSAMLLAAWVILLVIRRIADRVGLSRHLWHPALASLAIYVILLSAIIMAAGEIG
jgi:hypothetical protein